MWRSCTTNFTQIGKNKWKERAEIFILMLHVPCKMSNATYLTNFSSTKKYMKSWLDNLNGQTYNYFREYGCQYAHFYKTQPCSKFFSAKNSCTKYPKNPTYRLVSNISQRQTDGQTDRRRETDGRILHKHVFFSVRK